MYFQSRIFYLWQSSTIFLMKNRKTRLGVDKVKPMMDYPMPFVSFFTFAIRRKFYYLGFLVVEGVAQRILVSAPVPLGLIWVLNWVGLGWGWA